MHLLPWALRLHLDPIWFFSALTSGLHGGLLPGRPYLDPNVGFTTEALGTLAARDWVHGVVPWWNPYTGIGMPLAGEMQPGAFFLPFNLLLLLPGGVVWLTLAMQFVSGVTGYALLRELGGSRLAAVLAGVLLELNSTMAWSPGPSAVFCALPFLPLVCWGIERARRPDGGAAGPLAIAGGIAYMVLAGFPETSYINGLLALAWAGLRLAAVERRVAFLARVLGGGALGLLLAAPQLVAFVDDLAQSDAIAAHQAGHDFLPLQALGMAVLPYVTGPPTVDFGSAVLGGIWGAIGGYMGLLTPLLALAGLAARRQRGLKLLLLGWVAVALAKSFGQPQVMAVLNHVPAMLDLAFYRYSPPSWGFALAVAAALALDEVTEHARRPWWPFLIAALLLVGAAWLTRPARAVWAWPAWHGIIFVFWGVAVLVGLAGLGVALWCWRFMPPAGLRRALALLLAAEAFGFFLVPLLTGTRHGQVDMKAVAFLQARPALLRGYALGPMMPNYSALFGLPMIDHNVLPVPELWARYVDAHVLPGVEPKSGGIIFWPGWTPYGAGAGDESVRAHLADLRALGVGYVVTGPADAPPGLAEIYADKVVRIWNLPGAAPYFETRGGPCAVAAMGRVDLMLDCAAPALLVRREFYMPGWRAQIGGRDVAVGPVDGVFQAVPVPAGVSHVRFWFAPPFWWLGWAGWLLGGGCAGWLAWRQLRHEYVYESGHSALS